MRISPIYRFMLVGALWLPAAFFLWFAYAAQFAWPVVQLSKWVLLHVWPDVFLNVLQGADEIIDQAGHHLSRDFWLQVNTNVVYYPAIDAQAPKAAFFDFAINPMIYGYSVPLFAGLVMATPLAAWHRALQIAVGVMILWLVQCFGVVAEAFKTIGVDLHDGPAALHRLGYDYSLDAIALCYQFGYLILPPLVPAVLWILFNRSFIEELTRPPSATPAGPSPAAEPNRADGVEVRQSGDL